MRTRLVLLCMLTATNASSDPGFVRSWVEAQGGCRQALPVLQAVNSRREKTSEFLGKSFSEWTDSDVAGYQSAYADCYSIVNTPAGIRPDPQNSNVLMFTAKKVAELRSQVDLARSEIRARAASLEARKRLALEEDATNAARIARERSEETAAIEARAQADIQRQSQIRQDAELAAKARDARLAAAKVHAKHEEEAAAEIERQAEAEERSLSEAQSATNAARDRRQAAEKRLAEVRARADAQRSQSEAPQSPPAPSVTLPSAQTPQAPAPADQTAVETPTSGATGCDMPVVRKMFMQEFNDIAKSKFLPTAIDLTQSQTDKFYYSGDNLYANCRYLAQLDNGKRQHFLLESKANSLGEPYISFKPLGRQF